MARIIRDSLLNWIPENSLLYAVPRVKITGVADANNKSGHEIVFCNELDEIEHSSIFSFLYNETFDTFGNDPNYYTGSLFQSTKDYQALTRCQNFILAATSLECPDSRIIYWDVNKKAPAELFTEDKTTIRNNILDVFEDNTCACDNTNYIKLEGLTCIPNKKYIIFGLAYAGNCQHCYQNKALLIKASYEINNDVMVIRNNFSLLADFDITTIAKCNNIHSSVACSLSLSDLTFDQSTNKIYILTKFNLNSDGGGYLWGVNWLNTLDTIGTTLTPIKLDYPVICETPYVFPTIPRGIGKVKKDTFIVVMDHTEPCACCHSTKFRYQLMLLK